jgi:hypothetical protein
VRSAQLRGTQLRLEFRIAVESSSHLVVRLDKGVGDSISPPIVLLNVEKARNQKESPLMKSGLGEGSIVKWRTIAKDYN